MNIQKPLFKLYIFTVVHESESYPRRVYLPQITIVMPIFKIYYNHKNPPGPYPPKYLQLFALHKNGGLSPNKQNKFCVS